MFRYLLCGALLVAPTSASATDTVWWRTDGAVVMQQMNECLLYFYTKERAAIFTWRADGSETIAFQDDRFHFGDEHFTVGMRIDDHYLTGDLVGDGTDGLLIVALPHPIDQLLPHASEVQIRAANDKFDYDVTVPLLTAKIPALLTAVGKCRTVLKH